MKYSNLLNASQELLEGRIELSFNGLGIGEEAVSKSSIELQNLKIRTICQTKNRTAILPIPC
jgi:hypothetical protein